MLYVASSLYAVSMLYVNFNSIHRLYALCFTFSIATMLNAQCSMLYALCIEVKLPNGFKPEYCFENDKNGIKEFSSTNTVMEESDIGLESVEIGMNKEETNEIEENGEEHINDDSSIQHDKRFEKVQEGNKINEVQGNSDASKSEIDNVENIPKIEEHSEFNDIDETL